MIHLAIFFMVCVGMAEAACYPEDFSKPWVRVEGVWYTRLPVAVTWYDAEERCRSIEPGRSTLASIRYPREQNRLMQDVGHYGDHWTGAVRVADKLIYWFKNIKNIKVLEDLTMTHWKPGQPDGNQCVVFHSDGNWEAHYCTNNNFPLCELRCT